MSYYSVYGLGQTQSPIEKAGAEAWSNLSLEDKRLVYNPSLRGRAQAGKGWVIVSNDPTLINGALLSSGAKTSTILMPAIGPPPKLIPEDQIEFLRKIFPTIREGSVVDPDTGEGRIPPVNIDNSIHVFADLIRDVCDLNGCNYNFFGSYGCGVVQRMNTAMFWTALLYIQGYGLRKKITSGLFSTDLDLGFAMTLYSQIKNKPWDKCTNNIEKEYLNSKLEILNWIIDNNELPGEVKVPVGWDSEQHLDSLTTLTNPIGNNEQVEEVIVEEIVEVPLDVSDKSETFIKDLEAQGAEKWAASRAPDIEAVKQNIDKYENADPDEVIAQAEQARKELVETKEEEDAKIAEAQKELVKTAAKLEEKKKEVAKIAKEVPLTAAETQQLGVIFYDPYSRQRYFRRQYPVSRYIGLSGIVENEINYYQLGGFGSKLKKAFKKAVSAVSGAVSRGFSSVSDEVKRSIKKVGAEISRSAVGKEIKRVEKKVRKEVFRATARFVKIAPFIKLLAPFLGFFIPGIGNLLSFLILAAVAGAEVGYAYRMKIELKEAAKKALKAIRDEIAALQIQIDKLEELAKVLEAKRLKIAELAKLESAKRKELVAKLFETEEARSKRMLYAAALGSSALVPFFVFKKPGIFSYLYLLGVGAGAFYLLRETREIPEGVKKYNDCVTFATEDLCRAQYIQESLKNSLPELSELPKLQQEVQDLLRKVSS